jgi:hypothetical protein
MPLCGSSNTWPWPCRVHDAQVRRSDRPDLLRAPGVEWTDPDLTASNVAARDTTLRRSAGSTSSTNSPVSARATTIDLISYAVGEMFKLAAAEGLWPPDRLGTLFKTVQVGIRAGDRRDGPVSLVVLRRRHRLRRLHSRRRNARLTS